MRKKKKARGARREVEREEERLSPFSSSHRPPSVFKFLIIAIFVGYPAGASAEESGEKSDDSGNFQ